ncbi:coil containing protein [Vibrio phage 1.152.O._10N.222.46.E1]|uniref:Coil containing protein n=4 Tax=Nahantvirus 49C7 TaxID=2846601 RepID=A0A2I7RBB4_9CAUD|nr:coil containing protein [Vibrio phage 1.025.O._10N.222.46.B6]AUR90754.1 coil containing protein [Vibrio phage 1.150.O._10N.222.46.A6]AUR90927.1 coil containing protein [Vibrio phage 1.152.O._10N.222.46.E1]AUS02395.1 coil containing protein [Vibrio phage 2.130.O._10N.222.46.C2]
MTDTTEDLKLQTLKKKADMLGVTYHPSIGMDKLKEKVDAKMAETPTTDPVNDGAIKVLDKGGEATAKRREASKLVRIIINTRDPNKKDWPGEIFSVGNRTAGFYKKYVPYGIEWHVPQIIFNTIRDKKVQIFVASTDSKGRKIKAPRIISAYSVEVLDPLTAEELADLAKAQQASGRLEEGNE